MNGPYTPWGYPMPPPYAPAFPPSSGVVYVPMPAEKTDPKRSVMDMIQEAENAELAWKAIKKRLKEEEKKDDDDKKKKKKDDEINWEKFFQYAGILAIGSFPMIWVQMKFFEWASTALHGLH